MRTEFGFERTVSATPEDIINCKHMPSFLVPADLPRMAAADGFEDVISWGLTRLLASPGALVIYQGRPMRIRTLVPARNSKTGHCRWLSKDFRCKIHEISPFGCAFVDSKMDETEGQKRSQRALAEIFKAWQEISDYSGLWCLLFVKGLRAPGPEACREKIAEEYARTLK